MSLSTQEAGAFALASGFFSNDDDAVNLAVSRECEGQLETKWFTKRTFLSQISALDKKKSGNLKRLIDD